jgi:hypothetical protein
MPIANIGHSDLVFLAICTPRFTRMNLKLRIAITGAVFPAAYFFVFWVPLAFVPLGASRWPAVPIALVCAGLASRYTWRRLDTGPTGRFSSILLGAIVVGSVAFCAGFFGPMIFAPRSNQGPLLGLIYTGPLGFLLGAAAGYVYWVVHGRHLHEERDT